MIKSVSKRNGNYILNSWVCIYNYCMANVMNLLFCMQTLQISLKYQKLAIAFDNVFMMAVNILSLVIVRYLSVYTKTMYTKTHNL